MASDRGNLSRKMAAIVHADVTDSTALVQLNEALAHERINEAFSRFSQSIEHYSGTVHEIRGDALVAEFPRASDAVCAALAFQELHSQALTEIDDEIAPTIRIGVSLGEVIFADGKVTGAGVVLAQRVEQLAEPGGLCITAAIHEALPQHMPFDQYDLGEQEVKGFEESVRVYRVGLKTGEAIPLPEKTKQPKASNVLGISAAVAAIVLVIAGGAVYWFKPWAPQEEPASVERMAFPLPDKPSIAVLPFDNLSDDQEQAYFTDGITNDIITDLSRFGDLIVIAAHSTFTYKGKPVKVKHVAEELGVRYVVEGSVQKGGDQVRINVQFIDAITGEHLWAERYARDLSDVFAVQDEIVQKIVGTLGAWTGQVAAVTVERARHKGTTDLTAYEHFLLGVELGQRFTKEDNTRAREALKKAIERDPRYARAYAALAWTHFFDWKRGWSESEDLSAARAYEVAKKAVELDENEAEGHWILAEVYIGIKKQPEEAIAEFERALVLNPNHADILADWGGYVMPLIGRSDEGIELVKKAMRLNPSHADWYEQGLGFAAYIARRYDEAISAFRKVEHHGLETTAFAASYAQIGRLEEARAELAKFLKLQPQFSIREFIDKFYFKNPVDLEHYIEGLRKAGLPEHPPLELPDKPSIAVLPFTNMSTDEEQEYFVDGMTEDITTDLSKIPGLFVIARNSAFTYKGKVVDVKEVSRELGVKYVLEGSVRRVGETARINAQLIDATTGGHVWADRYDGPIADIFKLQDTITQRIVSALAIELSGDDQQEIGKQETTNVAAYDLFLKGWDRFRRGTPNDYVDAVGFFKQAIALDGQYGRAHAALATTCFLAGERGFEGKLGVTFDESRQLARRHLGLALEHPTSLAHQLAATVALKQRLYEEARSHAEKAMLLDPSDARAHSEMAYTLLYAGTPDEAIEFANQALRLDPSNPGLPLQWLGRAEFIKGNLEEAVTLLERGRQHRPTLSAVLLLAAAYAQLGQDEDAQAALKIYHDKTGWSPTLKQLMYFWPYKDPVVAQRFADGLHRAGLSGPPGGYFVISEQNRVIGSKILELIEGRAIDGANLWDQEPWSRVYSVDGIVVRRDSSGESEGKYWVEDDLLCEQWRTDYVDCYPVFRNEKGSHETKDEYLSMLDTGIFPWSFDK